jgi:FkbH-like protein
MITPTLKEVLSHARRKKTGTGDIRVAIAGDHATQLFARLIDGWGYEYGLNLEVFEADYDQVDGELLNAGSGLHIFLPSYVIIALSVEKLRQRWYSLDAAARTQFAENELSRIAALYEGAGKTQVLVFNFIEEDDGVFGNFANKRSDSFLYQVRRLNLGLMDLGIQHTNLHIVDVKMLHQRLGDELMLDNRGYVNASMPFHLDALSVLARHTVTIMAALQGKFSKCIVLDLDNTTWGGIIGDDGMEKIQIGNLGIGKAFTLFQQWLKELKERGIILAVCSKNTEAIAREPFQDHPDMILRMEDIAVFIANWENKADNIRHIQKILNIGYDAMVFLDDNPVERALVREAIPGICVPELPEDPARYVGYLKSLNLFETASFTPNDAARTAQYREEAARRAGELAFGSHDEFLASLNMQAWVEPFTDYNIPRVAQLIQRSNQFNLRTIRYSEEDVKDMAMSSDYICFSVYMKDKFGDYGLISVIILKKEKGDLFIDTWVMSCRVLKRGVEEFVINEMLRSALAAGAEHLIGEYIPTPKNGLVEFLLRDAGFTRDDHRWMLPVASTTLKQHFIHDKTRSTATVE